MTLTNHSTKAQNLMLAKGNSVEDARADVENFKALAESEPNKARAAMYKRISTRAARFVETNGADASLPGDGIKSDRQDSLQQVAAVAGVQVEP